MKKIIFIIVCLLYIGCNDFRNVDVKFTLLNGKTYDLKKCDVYLDESYCFPCGTTNWIEDNYEISCADQPEITYEIDKGDLKEITFKFNKKNSKGEI